MLKDFCHDHRKELTRMLVEDRCREIMRPHRRLLQVCIGVLIVSIVAFYVLLQIHVGRLNAPDNDLFGLFESLLHFKFNLKLNLNQVLCLVFIAAAAILLYDYALWRRSFQTTKATFV